jgi:RNA polymerase sigma factor (sigma-70 family)
VGRRLTEQQQHYATEAMAVVQPAIRAFLARNPHLKRLATRADMESVALKAVCMAALTYDPAKSKVTTYFSTAIRHELAREIGRQQKSEQRYALRQKAVEQEPNLPEHRLRAFALKALKMLPESERTLLEDRLIEEVTLAQLGRENGIDPRTVSKRVVQAIALLRRVAADLP